MNEVTYITRDGDMLDAIVFARFGRTSNRIVEAVLEANRHLAACPPRLPAGISITLPADVETPAAATVKLWD